MEHKVKFRLWNNIQNVMIPHDRINFEFILDGEDHHDFNLMQFMGFQDSFKTDIYEGDILMGRYKKVGKLIDGNVVEIFSLDDSGYFVREWDKYIVAKFIISNKSCTFQLPSKQGGYGDNDNFISWKVVGNIYQNPEIDMNNENEFICNYDEYMKKRKNP